MRFLATIRAGVTVGLGLALGLGLAGCAATPAPHGAEPPHVVTAPPEGMPSGTVSGSTDDPNLAQFDIRFMMTVPGSAKFNFKDRDLSFYFRPTPEALNIQVENLQNRPVWIDWDRSVFRDIVGRSYKVAHSTTRWKDRYSVQAQTQIAALQPYADYMLPMDYLQDPAGRDEQLHRPLIPLDASAPQYSGLDFGVDMLFLIENQPRNYSFRFKVASVIPRPR
jgi:hypothetical protein